MKSFQAGEEIQPFLYISCAYVWMSAKAQEQAGHHDKYKKMQDHVNIIGQLARLISDLSLMNYISDALCQGNTILQSLVKRLDHGELQKFIRSLSLNTNKGMYSMAM